MSDGRCPGEKPNALPAGRDPPPPEEHPLPPSPPACPPHPPEMDLWLIQSGEESAKGRQTADDPGMRDLSLLVCYGVKGRESGYPGGHDGPLANFHPTAYLTHGFTGVTGGPAPRPRSRIDGLNDLSVPDDGDEPPALRDHDPDRAGKLGDAGHRRVP